MAPIVLQMEVHCKGCGKKIEKAIKKIAGKSYIDLAFHDELEPRGVTAVKPYVGEGRVEVEGTADAEAAPQQDPPPYGWHEAPPPDLYGAPPPQGYYQQYEHTPNNRVYTPSYFSDDNPNGCSVQ
uniref:HMA domain-containing protein n=1 Tax=Oryza brachyantha TaxID=4533 RepID=J3N2X4_ORYBR